ncbi:HET domain-containing protein [Fusarium sp. LHS14.1]|nr:HET domain-containing protein [Fusarium sp. LHS14.1]
MQHESLIGNGCANSMWSLTKGWLDECCQDHKCSVSQSPDFFPTRLIQIIDDATVRVIECRSNQNLQRYVAFSHCWGEAETLKLLKDNKSSLETGINISQLPQSYKEAIYACIRLDFNLIWIDSLCIIQDSTDDRRAESATMMHVYGNALLTIAAAAAAENSKRSLAHRDPLNIQPTTIMVPQEGSGEMPDVPYILALGEPFDEIKNSPLRRRAWVLQESYISNRILFLADTQLWWLCHEALCCESWPAGIPKHVMKETTYQHDRKRAHDIESAHFVWSSLVGKYTRCRLTNFSDKLIAMAGLASHLQPSMGTDEYVAGFWRSRLPHALCWGELIRPVEGFRPSQYRAPSWSWASLEGVEFSHCYDHDPSVTDTCQILDIHLAKAGTNPYGDLKGGYMLLRGRLFPAKTEGSFTSNFQYLKFPDLTTSPSRAMYAHWDEAISGKTLFSCLDTSGIDLLEDASLISAKRVTKGAEQWEGDLFYFPVFEFSEDEVPGTYGLILGCAKGEPVDRFQRLGWSRCEGEGPCSYFRGGESREFFII